MSHRSQLLCIISLLLFSGSARSQQPAIDVKQKPEVAAVQQKALKLLESSANDVSNLRSAENRARIGSNIAELLWEHDERRARTLFAATAEDLNEGFNQGDLVDLNRKHTLAVFSQLRRNIVERIARHDSGLALEYLHSTRPASDAKLGFDPQYLDRAQELQLAAQIAADNPQLALKLGRESLAKCFCSDLLPLLTKMGQKNKGSAQELYKEIVDKLKSANLSQDEAGLEFALTLVREFPSPAFDEQTYRDLLSVLLKSAQASGCAEAEEWSFLCRNIGSVYSQLEKYDPARAAGLRRWAGEEGFSFEEMGSQVRQVLENGTAEEILELAPRFPNLQFYIQRKAILKLESSGEAAKARQMAVALPEEGQRRMMLAELDSAEMWTSAPEEKLAEFQRELSSLRSSEERGQTLLSVAGQLAGRNRKTALSLLNQAGQILDSMKPGKEQLAGRVKLAMLYCLLKSERGFAIMESVIPKLNELVGAAATLDQFENTYLRDGEWAMSAEGNIGSLLTGLGRSAGYFAWSDFDRSVNLAGQFERPELRLMAQVKIAQAIMEGPPKGNPADLGFARQY